MITALSSMKKSKRGQKKNFRAKARNAQRKELGLMFHNKEINLQDYNYQLNAINNASHKKAV